MCGTVGTGCGKRDTTWWNEDLGQQLQEKKRVWREKILVNGEKKKGVECAVLNRKV